MAFRKDFLLDQTLGRDNSKDVRINWTVNHITSTPINRRNSIGKLNSSRRYSLAAVPQSPLVKPKKANGLRNHSFDLTSRSSIHRHLSTHLDSQSPGYTSRIVQYNEETEKSPNNTPSRRYGLGSFPIVHFFKKDLPILSRKSLQVNESIKSADLSHYNTPEQNKLLLEKIMTSPENGVSNTKSVLDALREISRKRIHSDEEEFNLGKDGKRICLDYEDGSSLKNKTKQKPQIENQRYIRTMIDEVTASYSSTTIENQRVSVSPKKISAAVATPPRPTPEQPKVKESVDVETQTPTFPPHTQPPPPPTEKIKENILLKENEPKQKKPSPVKIFDDTPLEIMRRKKLAILIDAHSNETKEVSTTASIVSTQVTSPTSILTKTKSPQKIEKHVTFCLPSPASTSSEVPVFESPVPTLIVTNTTTSLVTPIVSPKIIESTSQITPVSIQSDATVLSPSDSNRLKTIASDASLVAITTNSIQNKFVFNTAPQTSNTGGFKFDLQNENKSILPTFSPATTSSSMLFPSAAIGSKASPSSSVPSSIVTTNSKGGFSFNLTSTTATTAPTFNFQKLTSPVTKPSEFTFQNATPLPILPSSSVPTPPTFTFQNLKPTSTTTPSFSFQNSTTTTSNPPGFNFQSPSNAVAKPPSQGVLVTSSFSTPTSSVTAFTIPTFNTKPSEPAPSFNFSSNLVGATILFSFGTTGASTSTAAETIVSKPAPIFGFLGANSKPSIGVTTTTTSPFPQNPTATVAKPFTIQQPPSSLNFTGSSVFNKNDTPFVNPTSVPSIFNNPQISTTTVTTNTPFGVTPSQPSFSVTTASNKPIFGFSSTNSTPSFGNPTNNEVAVTSTNNIFGSFGGTASSTPAFGNQPPAFGTTSGQFSFGNSNFKPSSTVFGSTNAEVPVTTVPNNSFGSNTNVFSSGFGNSSSSGGIFDKPPTQEATAFESTSNPTFGSANFSVKPQQNTEVFAFGSNNTKPPVFSFGGGEPPKPSFNFAGEMNNSSAFGGGQGFGTGMQPAPPAFGSTSVQQQPIPGMFNIGAGGSSTPNSRPRTQLKAKRRT